MKYIKLTKNKRAVVDDETYDELSRFKWCYSNGYAKRRFFVDGRWKITGMHYYMLKPTGNLMVDHINGNGLDNRMQNLRLVTKSQNMMNSGKRSSNKSGFKGVCWDKRNKSWRASITKYYKHIALGHYKNIKDAVKAYNDAALIYHGEYAKIK